MVVVMMAMMMVILRKSRGGEEHHNREQECLFHSPIISPKQPTAIPLESLFWVRWAPEWNPCGHEKSSIALTAVSRLLRVRKKKTSAMSR
jgi:hypothetical protein